MGKSCWRARLAKGLFSKSSWSQTRSILFIYLFIYFTNFWGLKYQNVSQWNIVTSASVSAFRAGHHVTVYPSYICPVDSFVIRALNLILTV